MVKNNEGINIYLIMQDNARIFFSCSLCFTPYKNDEELYVYGTCLEKSLSTRPTCDAFIDVLVARTMTDSESVS